MTEDQKIYKKMGELLWSIMPAEAVQIYFIGQIFDEHNQMGFNWITKDNKKDNFDFDNYPYDKLDEMYENIRKLQKIAPYQKEPFTHFKVSLTEQGKFNFKVAYIFEEDSWPGLYMQGISELSQEEADIKYSVPPDIWEERQKKSSS